MRTKRHTRILLVSMIVVALIVTSLALVACNKPATNAKLNKPTDVFAFAGVSTGALLSGMSTGTAAMAGESTEVVDDTMISELNEYMSLVDSLVSGNPANNEVKASDRAEYKTMQVMNVPSLDGEWTEYRLYYNEDTKDAKADTSAVATSDGEEDDEDAEDKDAEDKDAEDKDEKESDEDEYESHITGIMVIGDREYKVRGDIEHEKDEQEIEFVAYLDDTNNNYIELSQELEGKETEYEYAIYYGGKLDSSFELEIETKDYKNECEIEITDKSGTTVEYKVEKDTSKDGKIKVEYTKNGVKGTFDVEATTNAEGKAIYKYYLEDQEIEKDRD